MVLGLSASDQALTSTADSLSEQVSTELAASGAVEVANVSDLRTALGFERQKQLLGCGAESSTCLTELSDALGAPWVVLGTLARLGDEMRLDLKLIRAADGVALARVGRSMSSKETFSAVTALVHQLLDDSGVVARAPSKVPAVVLSSAGAVVAGVGVGLLVDSRLGAGKLDTDLGSLTFSEAKQLAARVNLEGLVGPIVAGVGGAALIAGLVWLAVGANPPAVAVVPWLDGRGLVVRGTFP